MKLLAKNVLEDFAKKNPQARSAIETFTKKLEGLKASNIVEVRAVFPAADAVKCCTVFNVGGNNYRVVTRITYALEAIDILFAMTHSDYSKSKWKPSCEE